MKKLFVLIILLILPALALAAGKVDVSLDQKKVVTEAGKDVYKEFDTASAGTVVEYTAVYKNVGDQMATKAEGELPVPNGMTYVEKTANPAKVMATVDGKNFSFVPLKRAENKNGKEEVVEVPVKEYRALRWQLGDIAPGKSVTVKARMKVNE